MASRCRCCAPCRAAWAAQLALVHFDAHVDTWPTNFGQDHAHGSVFYHAIEEGLVDPRRMIQVGIRSPVQREVWDWTIGRGVTVLTAQDVHAAGPGRSRATNPRRRGRSTGLSQLRHRRARSGVRTGHRHAGNRRTGVMAGTGDPAPAARHRASLAWTWWRSHRPTMWPRSPRSRPPPSSGSISPWSGRCGGVMRSLSKPLPSHPRTHTSPSAQRRLYARFHFTPWVERRRIARAASPLPGGTATT